MSLLNLQRLVLNVSDPEAAAAWYRQNLGMKDSEPACADGRSVCLSTSGRVVLLELMAESPEHCGRQQFRRGFHQTLTLKAGNPLHEVFRLLSAGAKNLMKSEDGLQLVDPFGLQLIVVRDDQVRAA